MAKTNRNALLFQDQLRKVVEVEFETEALTSDGGAVLVGALDRGLGLTKLALSCFEDRRISGRVTHELLELGRQRVYGLVLGYEDCNDSARIAADPALKVAVGRGLDEVDLASTATLCRFENSVTGRELVDAWRELSAWRLESLERRFKKARVVTIDLDGTPDPTHGQQVFSFYNGHYGTYCFKPLVVSLSFDDDPEQYLVSVRLRPGNSSEVRTVIPMLRRLVGSLTKRWPKASVRVRADGGFGQSPRLLEALDELGTEYVLGYTTNKTLEAKAKGWAEAAEALFAQGKVGEETQVFGELSYKTKRSWSRERRVVVKSEFTATDGRSPRLNQRFVVTGGMRRFKPARVYAIYRARGDTENRIKELKQLYVDRTSCSRYLANAFRVLLSSLAYMLLQELRWRLRRTELRRAQADTLRMRLFKMAARVVETTRRLVFHCPLDFPWKRAWRQAAIAVGAAAG